MRGYEKRRKEKSKEEKKKERRKKKREKEREKRGKREKGRKREPAWQAAHCTSPALSIVLPVPIPDELAQLCKVVPNYLSLGFPLPPRTAFPRNSARVHTWHCEIGNLTMDTGPPFPARPVLLGFEQPSP